MAEAGPDIAARGYVLHGLAVPALSASGHDAGLLALAAPALDSLARAYDAHLANGIMRSLGMELRHLPRAAAIRAQAGDPFRAVAATAAAEDAGPGGVALADLANHHAGAQSGVAVSFTQHFAASDSFTSAVTLVHTAGPLHAAMAVTGSQGFADGQPMVLTYHSEAWLALMPALEFGVSARGGLGTLTTPAPTGTQIAEAMVQIHWLGRNSALSSDAGYDFAITPTGQPLAERFHVKLDLNIKL